MVTEIVFFICEIRVMIPEKGHGVFTLTVCLLIWRKDAAADHLFFSFWGEHVAMQSRQEVMLLLELSSRAYVSMPWAKRAIYFPI